MQKQYVTARLKRLRDDGLLYGFRGPHGEWMYKHEDVLAYVKGL